jgi:hypothetical protein
MPKGFDIARLHQNRYLLRTVGTTEWTSGKSTWKESDWWV